MTAHADKTFYSHATSKYAVSICWNIFAISLVELIGISLIYFCFVSLLWNCLSELYPMQTINRPKRLFSACNRGVLLCIYSTQVHLNVHSLTILMTILLLLLFFVAEFDIMKMYECTSNDDVTFTLHLLLIYFTS